MAVGIWKPEPLFWGKTVFILGNGPSLNQKEIDRLYPYYADQVVAINDSADLFPWARVLFFRDLDWFLRNKNLVLDWENEVVTPNVSARNLLHTIRRVRVEHVKEFRGLGSDSIKYGRTSGHLALSLAITMGASHVVLLGFDCRVVDGRSHWNDKAPQVSEIVYKSDFLRYWNGWGELAQMAGVRVTNATPGSAIKEFPFKSLSEFI